MYTRIQLFRGQITACHVPKRIYAHSNYSVTSNKKKRKRVLDWGWKVGENVSIFQEWVWDVWTASSELKLSTPTWRVILWKSLRGILLIVPDGQEEKPTGLFKKVGSDVQINKTVSKSTRQLPLSYSLYSVGIVWDFIFCKNRMFWNKVKKLLQVICRYIYTRLSEVLFHSYKHCVLW